MDLLAYWNEQIFPNNSSASHRHQYLLNENQQHEYNGLLLDLEVAPDISDTQLGLESDNKEVRYVPYKLLVYCGIISSHQVMNSGAICSNP